MLKRALNFIEKKKLVPVILTVLTSLFIFYISSLSSPPGAGGSSLIPKLYHFSIFFFLAFFFLASIKNGKMKLSYILLAFAFSLLYAILDELHQFFVPFRDPSFFDVMLDSSGILFSLFFYTLLSKK